MSLSLLSMTLREPSALTDAVYGNFSAPRAHEFAVIRGSKVEILRYVDDEGDAGVAPLQVACAAETFSVVRRIVPFRLSGSTTDAIAMTNDSGNITLLVVQGDGGGELRLKQVCCLPFDKSGCRRGVPGQYLAADPQGRAILVGAVEKHRLIFNINRDDGQELTISPPVEAHSAETVTFDVAALDVGHENPVFAAIEVDFSAADADATGEALLSTEKQLCYYELDLGLNHVTRTWSAPIAQTANMLLAVPAGDDGPGGVLVVAENWVAYRHSSHDEVRSPLPRRDGLEGSCGTLIVAAAGHRQGDKSFFLLQSEHGDLYKVLLERDGAAVRDVRVEYFDTLPVCNAMAIARCGLLLCAHETADHAMYQFWDGGAGRAAPVACARAEDASLGDDAESAARVADTFSPNRYLRNLRLLDEQANLASLNTMALKQRAFVAGCGRGSTSRLCLLRHGLEVAELAASRLPEGAQSIFSVPASDYGATELLVVAFAQRSLVLRVGESVSETRDSGLDLGRRTLAASRLSDGAILQIHSAGLRLIKPGGALVEWADPGGRGVEAAACGRSQAVLALSGGSVLLFEVAPDGGGLRERGSASLGADAAAMDLPEGPRAEVCAAACVDGSVRLLSLAEGRLLNELGVKMLRERASSVCFARLGTEVRTEGPGARPTHLFLGLHTKGVEALPLEPLPGGAVALPDHSPHSRPLGEAFAPALCRAPLGARPAVLALGSAGAWLYRASAKDALAPLRSDPLSGPPLRAAAPLRGAACAEGVACVAADGSLRILCVPRLDESFHARSLPLRYAPRAVVDAEGDAVVVLEAESGAFGALGGTGGAGSSDQEPEEEEEEAAPPPPRLPSADGRWASCVRVVGVGGDAPETLCAVELAADEAALSGCALRFPERAGEQVVCVGIAKKLRMHPLSFEACLLRCYAVKGAGEALLHLHDTALEDLPLGMAALDGRLLCGVGPRLRLYGMGKKRLLRKCERGGFPRRLRSVSVAEGTIFCGADGEGFFALRHRAADNRFELLADEPVPRFVSAARALDHVTVAAGDKFGGVFVLRLPREKADGAAADGAAEELDCAAHFHAGAAVTAVHLGAVSAGGREAIVYARIDGGVGAMVPLNKGDAAFFSFLESSVRREVRVLGMRDHMAYRSYFVPVKGAVDGDLCAMFATLAADVQEAIAEGLGATPEEVVRRVEDMRASLL